MNEITFLASAKQTETNTSVYLFMENMSRILSRKFVREGFLIHDKKAGHG